MHWKDETWHEVLRLIAGMVGEKQAEELILFLMEQDGREDKLANLMLAAGCLSEVRNRRAIQATDEALWQKFVEKVIRYDPPYHYESEHETYEAGPTRERAIRLMASVWRSEKTRIWLRSAAGKTVTGSCGRRRSRSWRGAGRTMPRRCPSSRNAPAPMRNSGVRMTAVHELAQGWKDMPRRCRCSRNAPAPMNDYRVRRRRSRSWRGAGKTMPRRCRILQERARSDDENLVCGGRRSRSWRGAGRRMPR